jgi:hypothetical protein
LAAVNVVCGYAELITTVASWPDVVVTASDALPPPEAQPTIKSMAISAEIPRMRLDTPVA